MGVPGPLTHPPSSRPHLLVRPVGLHQRSIQARFHIVKLLVILQREQKAKRKQVSI